MGTSKSKPMLDIFTDLAVGPKCDVTHDESRHFKTIINATCFAFEKYNNRINNKYPDIKHSLNVAKLLTDVGITDYRVICAALLSNTLEYETTTYNELANLFGEHIAALVDEIIHYKSHGKKAQLTNTRRSDSGRLIELCNKYCNLISIRNNQPNNWSPEMCHGYTIWCYALCNKQLFGVNDTLDNMLKELFVELNVSDANLEEELQKYYNLINDA